MDTFRSAISDYFRLCGRDPGMLRECRHCRRATPLNVCIRAPPSGRAAVPAQFGSCTARTNARPSLVCHRETGFHPSVPICLSVRLPSKCKLFLGQCDSQCTLTNAPFVERSSRLRRRPSPKTGRTRPAYEKSETQSFYNAFFDVFAVQRRSVAHDEAHVAKLDNRSGFIDLFWPGVLIVEQKSAGRDLKAAFEQAGEYFDALPECDRPRYILVSDFQTFELHDLDERETITFALADLPAHVEAFGFILGVQRRTFRDQDPANTKAAELVGRLHDALSDAGHRGHDLERFLVRVVFCMFADDTGVFEPRDIFLDFIETRTGEDGADLGPWLAQLFEVLDTPEDERAVTLDEDLARFPYVNGDLFKGHLRTFSFNTTMRDALLNACRFDWSNISPAIFGALFQSVMDPADRRAKGAHYTTEKNILKVIEPLFMDDLHAEFERLKARKDSRRRAELIRFQTKLGR